MKKSILFLTIFAMIIFSSLVLAESTETNYTVYETWGGKYDFSHLQVQQIKYEPYPVNPGEYFTMWVKIENTGNVMTENAIFELIAKYPFSLDLNEESVRKYGQIDSEPIVLEYKVRVDKDAVEGTNEIEFKFRDDTVTSNDAWAIKTFNIEVEDAQTDFDFVIQEINGAEIVIALANTGKNEAYSVIVRVPEQEYFEIVGTDGQMVGNLEDGDYTLVAFNIQTKRTTKESGELPLDIQIDYTDTLGERRTFLKTLNYKSIVTLSDGTIIPEGLSKEEFVTQRKSSMTQSDIPIYQEIWFWGVVVVILLIFNKLFKVYSQRKEEKEQEKHRASKNKK
ncbi:MAG: hypothetical protein U9R08_03335 [Nanoarchaeota archaeon]|nr:hypothetical protein [Nanoarchaeota archaeon]